MRRRDSGRSVACANGIRRKRSKGGFYALLEVGDAIFNEGETGFERAIVFAAGVFEPPILAMRAWKRRARNPAAHGDNPIDGRNIVERL